MPGLMRAMARTAVVAGTATATANAVNRRQARRNVEAYGAAQQEYMREQAPAYAAAAPQAAQAGSSMDEKLEALERLAHLKSQGILTEEEFAQQKAEILGS